MAREVKNTDGITWSCVQAYVGLSEKTQNQTAAQVDEERDTYWVVCTPSGGAKSVRLELPGEWETSYSDEVLLGEIQTQR